MVIISGVPIFRIFTVNAKDKGTTTMCLPVLSLGYKDMYMKLATMKGCYLLE